MRKTGAPEPIVDENRRSRANLEALLGYKCRAFVFQAGSEKTPEPVTPSVVVPPPVEEAPEPVTPSVVAPPPAEVAPQPAAPAETPSATDATDPETK